MFFTTKVEGVFLLADHVACFIPQVKEETPCQFLKRAFLFLLSVLFSARLPY
jgi:hypothetical protein